MAPTRIPSRSPAAALGFNSEAAERTNAERDTPAPAGVVAPTPSDAAAEGGVTAVVELFDGDPEADGREFDPEEAARLGAPPRSAAETEPKPAPSALSVPPDCVAAAGAVPGDAPAGEAAAGSPLIGTGGATSPTATAPPGQVSPQR